MLGPSCTSGVISPYGSLLFMQCTACSVSPCTASCNVQLTVYSLLCVAVSSLQSAANLLAFPDCQGPTQCRGCVAGQSVRHHLLTNYFHAILTVVLAQFSGLGFLDGMEGIIRLAEASSYIRVHSRAADICCFEVTCLTMLSGTVLCMSASPRCPSCGMHVLSAWHQACRLSVLVNSCCSLSVSHEIINSFFLFLKKTADHAHLLLALVCCQGHSHIR